MKEKLEITLPILVEGIYDKTKLASLITGTIIPVHGFSLFKDIPLQHMIRDLANRTPIIVLMDSDSAGFKLRGFIKGLVPKEQLVHLYIPDIYGKEKRKRVPSKEGTVGVEGVAANLLRELLLPFASSAINHSSLGMIEKKDLFRLGFSGGANSVQKRQELYKALGLPQKMPVNQLLTLLNHQFTQETFLCFLQEHNLLSCPLL